MADHSTQC